MCSGNGLLKFLEDEFQKPVRIFRKLFCWEIFRRSISESRSSVLNRFISEIQFHELVYSTNTSSLQSRSIIPLKNFMNHFSIQELLKSDSEFIS